MEYDIDKLKEVIVDMAVERYELKEEVENLKNKKAKTKKIGFKNDKKR